MKKKIAIIFILLLKSYLYSSEPEALVNLEQKIYEEFSRGSVKGIYQAIDHLLLKYPADPVSYIYYEDLYNLSDALGTKKILSRVDNLIRDVEASGYQNKNVHLLKLRIIREKLLYRTDYSAARKSTAMLAPVTLWKVSSTYKKYGQGDFDTQFLPELAGPNDSRIVAKKINAAGRNGTVHLKNFVYPDEGAVYAWTSFSILRPVKLRISSKSEYKLFINGREVFRSRANSGKLKIAVVEGTGTVSVMLKFQSPLSSFRMIATDEYDNPVQLDINTEKYYTNEFTFRELKPYPYDEFLKEINKRSHDWMPLYRMASYLSDMENEESISFFRNALNLSSDPSLKYMFASALIKFGKGNHGAAYSIEGWKIMGDIALKHPEFFPAAEKKIVMLMRARDYDSAFREGKRIISSSKDNLQASYDIIDFFGRMNFDAEFLSSIREFKREFPDSIYPFILESSYYRKKDVRKYRQSLEEILKKENHSRSVKALIKSMAESGEYASALSLVSKYEAMFDLSYELFQLLLKSGRHDEAKGVVFKMLLKNETPSAYFNLGLISSASGDDPLMYFQKAMSLNPSLFNISDYLLFLKTGAVSNPFSNYSAINEKIVWPENKSSYPADVIYRGRVFSLESDGSSRAYFEDVVHINLEKGADIWGDYRVPLKGKVRIVRARVYLKNGEYFDSYNINNIDGYTYINISGLQPGAILQLAYMIDNPVTAPRGSSFFSSPFLHIQGYEEPVARSTVMVIAPSGMDVNFAFRDKTEVKMSLAGEKRVYSAMFSGLNVIPDEPFSGSSLNVLPYFAFTTLKDYSDFYSWYNGICSPKSCNEIDDTFSALKGKTESETLQNVYDYVVSTIDLQSNLIYYPESPYEAYYKKSGTVEDRTLLAALILKKLGISSYPAFPKNRYVSLDTAFISPYNFSTILLYVKSGNGKFFDFSDFSSIAGVLSDEYSGGTAIVMLDGRAVEIETGRGGSGEKKNIISIVVDDSGNGSFRAETVFSGRYASAKKFFKNRAYHENSVNSYYAGMIHSPSLNSFSVKGESGNSDLAISAEGDCMGIAVPAAGRIIIHPFTGKSAIHSYIVLPERKHPLVIPETIKEDDIYRYHLPKKYRSSDYSKSLKLEGKFGTALFVYKKEKGSDSLVVTRKITIPAAKIEPRDYSDFVKFSIDLKSAENINVELLED